MSKVPAESQNVRKTLLSEGKSGWGKESDVCGYKGDTKKKLSGSGWVTGWQVRGGEMNAKIEEKAWGEGGVREWAKFRCHTGEGIDKAIVCE